MGTGRSALKALPPALLAGKPKKARSSFEIVSAPLGAGESDAADADAPLDCASVLLSCAMPSSWSATFSLLEADVTEAASSLRQHAFVVCILLPARFPALLRLDIR